MEKQLTYCSGMLVHSQNLLSMALAFLHTQTAVPVGRTWPNVFKNQELIYVLAL